MVGCESVQLRKRNVKKLMCGTGFSVSSYTFYMCVYHKFLYSSEQGICFTSNCNDGFFIIASVLAKTPMTHCSSSTILFAILITPTTFSMDYKQVLGETLYQIV